MSAATYQWHPEQPSSSLSVSQFQIQYRMTPKNLTAARKKLGLSPTEMAKAMGVNYDTYKSWQSGRRSMPAVAVRCVELLLKYPTTARKLASD